MTAPDSPMWREAEEWASQQQVEFTGDNWEDLARAAEQLADSISENLSLFHSVLHENSFGECQEGNGTFENVERVVRGTGSIQEEMELAAQMARQLAVKNREASRLMHGADLENAEGLREKPR